MKSEVSKRNQYYLPKHRYYELKHFCLQYKDWDKDIKLMNYLKSNACVLRIEFSNGSKYSRTESIAIKEKEVLDKMEMVDKTLKKVTLREPYLEVLREGLLYGSAYDKMEASRDVMPMSRNEYYILCRKFFWLLDKVRK